MIDQTTNIDDRHTFIKQLKFSVQKANEGKSKLALLLISVNRMHRINEVHDFKTGDAALKFLADKINEAKRENDFLGRLSGTTFGLVLSPIMNKGHAQLAAHKILRLTETPLEFEDHQIKLDISIGISLCPSHSSLAVGLLKKAEAALRLAKEQEAQLSITEDFVKDEINEFWDIELGIEQAIINSEFVLYYQPKINLKTGLPSGSEALIRWPHPNRGMIFPDQFIPVAEDHGHIKPMTIWILNVALRESAHWPTKFGPLTLSVNIPPNLMNDELVDLVDNALNIWQQDNVTLVLEILERSFALTNDDTFSTFQALQNLGTDISIDDFGTGYSALSYFKSIPARELKIDKSFIQNLLDEQGNYDIVTFIIQLSHAFNMRIVAEGVEDYKTFKALKELGCDYIQGYVASKPMPHQDFLDYMENYSLQEQCFADLYNEKSGSENTDPLKATIETADNAEIIEIEAIHTDDYSDKVESQSENRINTQSEPEPDSETINSSLLNLTFANKPEQASESADKEEKKDLSNDIDFGNTII